MSKAPNWQQVLAAKHEHQIQSHEDAYGKLGELQTKKQKQALKQTLKGTRGTA